MSIPHVAFVTGGTGFVGSHVVEGLLARGVGDVRCLVRSDPKWLEGQPVTLLRGDLTSVAALREGARGADLVVHVAGLTRARTQGELDRANVDGTVALLHAVQDVAPAVQKVLVTSSLEAMGPNEIGPDGRPVPATETDTLRPISMYGQSKARMEEAVWRERDGVPVVVVRPPAVYGPRETDLFEMVKGASRGLFPIVGDGQGRRLSLVHVRDLVRGMLDLLLAPQTDGETYFVSSESGYSWDRIRHAVEQAVGRRTLKLPLPPVVMGLVGALSEEGGRLVGTLPPLTRDKAEAARHAWTCSVEKAARAVGYAQTVPLDEGMTETVAWYRARGWL